MSPHPKNADKNTSVDSFDEFCNAAERLASSFSVESRALWAKTPENREDKSGAYLSLPQHLIDSACVALALTQSWLSNQTLRFLEDESGLDSTAIQSLITFVAGSHDIGKATCTFQTQLEPRGDMSTYADRVRAAGLDLTMSRSESRLIKFPHSGASQAILLEWLENHSTRPIAMSIASISAAHHGTPAIDPGLNKSLRAIKRYPDNWKSVHEELLNGVSHLTGFDRVLPTIAKPLPTTAIQILTGIVIMADWIASNQAAFPLDLHGSQTKRVRKGLDFIELSQPWHPGSFPTDDANEYFHSAFCWPSEFSVRPVQRAAFSIANSLSSASLMIIEAPTGEGKTEAGLAAAHAFAANAGSQGIAFAAPTMSTSNGLFSRVCDWATQVTPDSQVSTMFLGHSKSSLNPDFTRLKFHSIGSSSGSGAVTATHWLAGRKRGILSNFVVCTVDQVLMMALQSRHLMLRHLGFSGKAVIIDEAHSYDVYMSEYLGEALQWLARYGCSVIVMSATLPIAQRQSLVASFAHGLNVAPPTVESQAYPLISVINRSGFEEHPVEVRSHSAHFLVEKLSDDDPSLVSLLTGELSDGGIALVVCNTVKRAQHTFQALQSEFPGQVELHHAAFMASHRSSKEAELRHKLGPDAHRGGDRPDRLIVVSTQVAEQSLDIDADLLVTDIAPMDLIIQRIGRIHRHSRPESDRPENLRTPQIFIRGITEWDPVPVFESGTAAVYSPAVLYRTFAVAEHTLFTHGFTSPEDVSPLVQRTYSPSLPIPAGWEEEWTEAQKVHAEMVDWAIARARSYRIPDPKEVANDVTLDDIYKRSGPQASAKEEDAAGQAQVRDSTPTVEVIPIIQTEFGYVPLANPGGPEFSEDTELDYSASFTLAASSVRLPSRLTRYPKALDAVLDQLETSTPVGWIRSFLLKGEVALRLDENRQVELNGHLLQYSEDLGLMEVDRHE